MSSNRAFLVPAAVIAAVLVLGVTAAIVLLSRDSPAIATGDLIAYGCKEKNNHWYAICVIRSDGTGVERLTSKLETTDPAWSRDGRHIAFTRNQDVGESTKFTSDDVFVMESDGDDARRLTPERVGRSSGQPAWSPDGEQIVYVDGPKVFSGVPSRFGSLFVVDSDGGEARRLTRGSADTDPDWSPNGNEIVFTRGVTLSSPTDANEDIYVLDVATGATHQLTATPAGVYETAPAWSPDGSRIAFARGTNSTEFDGKSNIYVMNRDGSGERLLLANTLFAESPYSLSWSPDGRLLAFETSSMLGCTSISILDVASGTSRPLTSCTRPIETTVAPSWQPAAG
jgi:TolB protein